MLIMTAPRWDRRVGAAPDSPDDIRQYGASVKNELAGASGALMVCGTTSDSGKSTFVAGLARALARTGARVAPFKAQNMANNSFITPSGHEIGRAQGLQAIAARTVPEVAMNPVLLKPTGERTSQVVVLGKAVATMSAAEYHAYKPQLLELVLESLADLRSRFDVVLCEGAGSPAEINLLANDIVNLRIAYEADIPAIVVGDINPGGVFAALFGTVGLLPDHYRALVRGFVINKLRGDPALLLDGTAQLEAACGVPTLGVLPWIDGLALDAEDSLGLAAHGTASRPPIADALDIAVVRLPYIANFTDFDPLTVEAGVNVRYVHHASALGRPDLVIVPGSKATVADLRWLRANGFADVLAGPHGVAPTCLGICAGYQMFGGAIDDRVESREGVVEGLGLLDVRTMFDPAKVTAQRRATATVGSANHGLSGYQIHHGRVVAVGSVEPWMVLDDGAVEVSAVVGTTLVMGTTLHGLFEDDGFRRVFLADVAARAGKMFRSDGASFADARNRQIDRLADAIEEHVDCAQLASLMASASAPNARMRVSAGSTR